MLMPIPMIRTVVSFLLLLPMVPPLFAQHTHSHSHTAERPIEFPDVPGYVTLKCDFHQHSVFSDGSVWPDIRVEEAVRDDLDAISLTEHLEYQPHKDDIPHPDRNRSYELAKDYAAENDLLIVHGSEITRDMPPGHSNAIFIQDANAILKDDAMDAFREANRQGAFVFWNHPDWVGQTPDGIAMLAEVHHNLIGEKLLHGIEVVNERTLSEEALAIALEHDLTILGTSDIHGLVDWEFELAEGGHRPITLVFARERTAESIKEALFAGRTAVWFRNDLIGLEANLQPLIESSLKIRDVSYLGESSVVAVAIENVTDASFVLKNIGPTTTTFQQQADVFTAPPHATTVLHVKGPAGSSFELAFEVLNAVSAPRKHPVIRFSVPSVGPRAN